MNNIYLCLSLNIGHKRSTNNFSTCFLSIISDSYMHNRYHLRGVFMVLLERDDVSIKWEDIMDSIYFRSKGNLIRKKNVV